jgi:hypothetical protein
MKFFCAHKHKTLTILSLTAANVSSTLCSRILGTPVARECRIFHNLENFFITHALWGANELIYKNPSDIASYFKTSVPVYSLDYLSKSLRKHTNDRVETYTDVAFFVLTAEAMKLSLVTRCALSFEGSWFTHFDWTSYFQNVGSRLPDCTELHSRNSKPTIYRFTSPCSKTVFNYAFVYPATSTSSPQTISSHDFLDKSDWYV